ncbi:MAG: hypothetical protein ACM3XM_01175 [Mycobacterium leprae]
MAETCAACGLRLDGKKTLWEYKGVSFSLCPICASLPQEERVEMLRPALRQIDRQEQQRQQESVVVKEPTYRTDIREEQLEEIVLHAFIDLIQERKAAGKQELVATMETIAQWLSDRTTLPIRAQHVQSLTLALRDAHIISTGGGGIGKPNSYDLCEDEMGIDNFWDQVDAFLMVWRLPNRSQLLIQ